MAKSNTASTPNNGFMKDLRSEEKSEFTDINTIELGDVTNSSPTQCSPKSDNIHLHKGIIVGANMESSNSGICSAHSISFIAVLIYIFVGIIFYGQIEGWGVVDCIYFCMVIITTVGYGDLTPSTTSGKAFTIFFALFGIGTIGIALGRIAEWFMSRQEQAAKDASKKILKDTGDAAASVAAGNTDKPRSSMKLNASNGLSEDAKTLLIATGPIFASVLIGMVIGYIEEWSFLDCLYTTVITVTTIGFGDLSPQTTGGRAFAIIYLPFAVISVANAIGNIAELIAKRGVVDKTISMKELIEMDSDGDGQVSQVEYLSYMLIKLGKADQEDIDEILDQFRKMDADNSGFLDKVDLQKLDDQLARKNQMKKI